MEIRNLANTDIKTIVECMAECFKNYFVKIPNDVDFWDKRYKAARVDYNLSFGAFDGDDLVAFIINGIDVHNEEKTAFNTGTGVLEAYRGQKLVDQIYSFALPILRENGITKCMLEVIEQNDVAVRVYERIGFQKDRFLRCFSGELIDKENNTTIQEVDTAIIKDSIAEYQSFYAWDNAIASIVKGGEMFKSYLIKDYDESEIGYFVINKFTNALIQIEAYQAQDWDRIIGATKKVIPSIRINNVDNNREECIDALKKAGLENHINQFEMLFHI